MVLTIGRMVLAPVFFLLYSLASSGSPWLLVAVWLVFAVIEVSDILDGYLARLLGQESEAGKVLDPLADAISRLTYFICLTGSGIMQLWVLLVLVYRDLGVAYIRVFASRSGVLMPARLSGKLKAWVYAIAGILGIVIFSLGRLGSGDWVRNGLERLAPTVFVLTAIVALWSLADYGVFFFRNFRRTS